jgi:phage gpG-like protein
MSTKYKTEKDKFPEFEETLKSLNNKKVKIGALRGENAWLAGIHEYGCNISVTPKMRAFLHKQGLHLKDSTKVINIPERSFLRTGHDKKAEKIMKQTERALSQVIDGKMSVDDMLDLCGEQFATAIKTYMRDLSKPKNHPYTVEQKGSSNPLVDTGGLLESITWIKE